MEFEYQFYLARVTVRCARFASLRSLCSARSSSPIIRRYERGDVRGSGQLSAQRADSANNGSDRAKSRNKRRSDRENPIDNGKSLPDSRNGFLGQPALLVGRSGGKSKGGVHFKDWLYYTCVLLLYILSYVRNTTRSRMRQSPKYPARAQHDNSPASCDIPSTTPAFLRRISDEAPSNRSSAREYSRNSLR